MNYGLCIMNYFYYLCILYNVKKSDKKYVLAISPFLASIQVVCGC